MNLLTIDREIELLTPAFSGTWRGGKNLPKDAEAAKAAEWRAPAIRGHVRQWHRRAFGPESANRVWGSASGDTGKGSRVALTVEVLGQSKVEWPPILPHKSHGQGCRPALPAKSRARIRLRRLVGCTDEDWKQAQAALDLWTLLGSVGYRSNRAAGSVWPVEAAFATPEEFLKRIQSLGFLTGQSASWALRLAPASVGSDAAKLRHAASDTVSVPKIFGSAQPRTPSPVQFKVVRLDGNLRLLIQAPKDGLLDEASRCLANKPLQPKDWRKLYPRGQ